jgi:hypothetical protein
VILGRRARSYLRELDPAVEIPSARARLGPFVLFGAALVMVLATLAIPVRADSRAEARHLRFGYPLHFVEGDVSQFWSGRPYTSPFNPWEDMGHVLAAAFLLDWAIVTVALAAPFLLVRRRTS